jgi:excisionase family DNA binding protein
LKFEPEELNQLADAVSERVFQRLKPLLSNKDNGKDRSNLLSVEDLAEYLDVEKDWVYSHIKEIPHFKVGRFPRFRKRDVDRWLEAQKAPQYTAPGRTAYNL